MRGQEDEYVSLREILRVLGRWFWVLVLMILLCTGTAVGLSLMQTPQYQSSIKVLVGQREDTAAPYNLGSDVQGLQQLTLTLTEAARNRPLAVTIIRRFDLNVTPEEFLEKRLSVEPITDTQFIQMNYTDPDPRKSQQVVNALGEVFSERISDISSANNAITATIWEPAALPDEPVSPNPIRNGLVGLGLGLLLGLALVYLLDYLDNSWRSLEEVEQVSGVATFGVVPELGATSSEILKGMKGGKN